MNLPMRYATVTRDEVLWAIRRQPMELSATQVIHAAARVLGMSPPMFRRRFNELFGNKLPTKG